MGQEWFFQPVLGTAPGDSGFPAACAVPAPTSQVSSVAPATPAEKNWPPGWHDKLAGESHQYTAPQAIRSLAVNCL